MLATQVFLDTYAFTGITEEVANEVREALSTATFAKILDKPSTFITVAVHGVAIVGFAQTTIGTPQPFAPDGEPAELDRLYVQEPFTGHGIGSRLLLSHEALAARQGSAVLWLSPWVGNQRALRFYAKHEYEDYKGWQRTCCQPLSVLVGPDRFELSTNGLRVRCSTN